MSKESADHDLLVRIDANLVAFNRTFQEHVTQDIKEFANLEMKIDASHRRVDGFVKIGNMILGVFVFITTIGSIVGALVTLKHMGWLR